MKSNPHCEQLQKTFDCCEECFEISTAASENKKRFSIETKNSFNYCRIKVDACLISDDTHIKCDYAFLKCDSWHFMFFELKGTDIESCVQANLRNDRVFQKLRCQDDKKQDFWFYCF